jgi:hypothetical protein
MVQISILITFIIIHQLNNFVYCDDFEVDDFIKDLKEETKITTVSILDEKEFGRMAKPRPRLNRRKKPTKATKKPIKLGPSDKIKKDSFNFTKPGIKRSHLFIEKELKGIDCLDSFLFSLNYKLILF